MKEKTNTFCSIAHFYHDGNEAESDDCYIVANPKLNDAHNETLIISLGTGRHTGRYFNRHLKYDKDYEIYLITFAEVEGSLNTPTFYTVSEPIPFSGNDCDNYALITFYYNVLAVRKFGDSSGHVQLV